MKRENKKSRTKKSRKSSSKKSNASKSSVNNMKYEIARDMGLDSSRECSNESRRNRRDCHR